MGTHKYLLDICYTCQKCLHCFQSSQQDSCKCKKSKQLLRIKKPKRGQQIYQRVFTPNPLFPKANKFLLDANIKFNYIRKFYTGIYINKHRLIGKYPILSVKLYRCATYYDKYR